LTVRAPLKGLKRGESVAINGACLTVEAAGKGWFRARAVPTTLERTLLGTYQPGTRVNLERAVRAGDRLGGHLVQGHVDGVADVLRHTHRGDALLLDLSVPEAVADVTVRHGSVTVDGVSLTVNDLPEPGVIQVALIPYTRDHTTLGGRRTGDRVQIEADLIGKYVRQMMDREAGRAV
ncbi:MAG: riboflavin synthase, partial [Gemmatimonadales bacterium]